MSFCEFIKGIDFFGKIPELYIKGKSKQVTIIGRIFTTIFIILYILIFSYKVYRMSQRVDITFYDSYSNTNEIPSIKITDNNFSLVFAVLDEFGYPFIDENIYYPEAYFSDEGREGIKIERCDPNKISPEYKQYFEEEEISNYYCLSDINFSFQPFMNSLRVEIFPCVNSSENDFQCETQEIIEERLNERLFMIYFQDIMLTPLNFNSPIKEKINYLNTEIYKNLGQYLHTQMQVVKIETTTNIIGFDFLTEPKVEEFIKFDNEVILPYPGYNLDDDDNTYPISIFELQLNDKILLEKRQYIQLIDVLGEIGGFMEIMYSFFSVICSLIADVLYEKKITNNLFSFDLDKKLILIKKGKNSLYKITREKTTEEPNINGPNIFQNNSTKKNNKKKLVVKKTKIKDNKDSNGKKRENSQEANFLENAIRKDNIEIHPIKNSAEFLYNKIDNTKKENKDSANLLIINKIHLKDLLNSYCYCCKRQRKNIYNLLLNESMNIITEKLDILNIFRNICSIEYSNNDLYNKRDVINMSDECSKEVSEINK